MFKKTFLLIALICGLFSATPANAAEKCTFANPTGQKPLGQVVISGMHAVGKNAIPGLDGVGPVYPMFRGKLSSIGWEQNPSGLSTTYTRIEGVDACKGWAIHVYHLQFANGIEKQLGQIIDEKTLLGFDSMNGVDLRFASHWHYSVGHRYSEPEFQSSMVVDAVGPVYWINPLTIVEKTVEVEQKTPEVLVREPEWDVMAMAIVSLLLVASFLMIGALLKSRTSFVVSTVCMFVNTMFVLLVIGLPPYELRSPPTQDQSSGNQLEVDQSLLAWARQKGIGEKNFIANALASSVCWSSTQPGKIVKDGRDCRKVDLLLLLAIDATETTEKDLGFYDPTKPGPMGWMSVEESAARRWGSAEGYKQLVVIWQILDKPSMLARYPSAIVDRNGNGIYEPWMGDKINVYGSSATCIGRSQGLPSSIMSFTGDLVRDKNFAFDPWNDPVSSAMFKAAHLANSYVGNDVWERRYAATVRYNPGAAQLEWTIASRRMSQLADIPTLDVVVKQVNKAQTQSTNPEDVLVLHSTQEGPTVFQKLLANSKDARVAYSAKGDAKTARFWFDMESTGCAISRAFAARPCEGGDALKK